jgi:hypothetical protein
VDAVMLERPKSPIISSLGSEINLQEQTFEVTQRRLRLLYSGDYNFNVMFYNPMFPDVFWRSFAFSLILKKIKYLLPLHSEVKNITLALYEV